MARIGRYEVLSELGSGGMGSVYRAMDTRLQRAVALKLIRLDRFQDPAIRQEFSRRFEIEARAVARLDHPNIVNVYDFDEVDGQSYLVMELVEGASLSARLHGFIPIPHALSILRGAASALDHAHSHGVVHRDVKPANLLVRNDGVAKLTDFGIARITQDTGLTRTGEAMGTPHYMSPEALHLRADHPVGPRSDQYSLAVVAFELLSGRLPFQADSIGALVLQIVTVAPPPLGLSSAVDAVLQKALAKELSDRYPSCSDFIEALAQACAGTARVPTGDRTEILPKPTPQPSADSVRQAQEQDRQAQKQERIRADAERAQQIAAEQAAREWARQPAQQRAQEAARLREQPRPSEYPRVLPGARPGAVLSVLFSLHLLVQLHQASVGALLRGIREELHLSSYELAVSTAMFTAGYALLALPGALVVQKWRAGTTLALAMFLWTLSLTLEASASISVLIVAARFLEGAAAGTVFAGGLTCLARSSEPLNRARTIAWFIIAIPVSQLLAIEGIGLFGWRGVTMMEAVFGLIAAVAAQFLLPVREVLPGNLPTPSSPPANGSIALLCAIFFLAALSSFTMSFLVSRTVGALLAPGIAALWYVGAAGLTVFLARLSDRSGERRWHAAVPLATAAFALLLFLSDSFRLDSIAGVFCTGIAMAGVILSYSPLWAIAASFSRGTAAVAIGLISTAGILGNSAGQFLVAPLVYQRSYFLFSTAVLTLLSAVLILLIPRRIANRPKLS
jgi:predicted MFS family arabinose efflux permease/tRNA A-37 threonylcarbamoyl transferase component Bud32